VTGHTDRRLTLVRHAESASSDRSLDDFGRPLNACGERDAAEMASRAVAAALAPTLIVTSPARRALETARIFAAASCYPPERIRTQREAYLASPQELLGLVRATGGSERHVMLFGHNPGISAFGAWLAGDESRGEVPTCAITSLLVPVRCWRELEFGTGQRDFYDFPRSRP